MKKENEIEVGDELMARYLSGEATPEEAMALHNWVKDPQNSSYFEKMAATWERVRPDQKFGSPDKEGAWTKLTYQMKTMPQKRKQARVFGLKKMAFGIAASVLVLLISGLFVYHQMNRNTSVMLTITTTDEFKNVTFSDSSTAKLYRNTSLSFPDKFTSTGREIHLGWGEAFFNIADDKYKPFTVHTELADISVLGTSFNIVSEKHRVEVSVKEGRVAISTAWDNITLDEGFSAIVSPSNGPIIRQKISDVNVWAYATGRFEFKDTPVSKIILSLKKAFPTYSLGLSDKNIGTCKVTATFQDESVDKIVDLIVETLNLSVTRNGTTVILEGKGCP